MTSLVKPFAVPVPQEFLDSLAAFEALVAELGTALAVQAKLGGMTRLLRQLEDSPAARWGVAGGGDSG
jgi:hypothetical protein